VILDSAAPVLTGPGLVSGRLIWAGPLTVLTSVVAMHAVRLAATAALGFAPGHLPVPLVWIPATADTVIFCGLGVVAFAIVDGFFDGNPVRNYRLVAFAALLVSFLPILMMFGRNRSLALAVALMHVAAYLPCVTLLPWLTTESAPVLLNKETTA
jgi:hypothetical protein